MTTHLIDGELTIFTASELKQQLLTFLNGTGPADINLSQVSEIDTAGLQLLILLKREAAKVGKIVNFVMHSPAVLEILELTKLTSTFGDQVLLSKNPESSQ